MIGGDHGRLKHGPPEGHSPISESLMPKERLRIEPCFHLGNIPKGLVCGPAEVRDHTAFVPKPVDTSHVSTALPQSGFFHPLDLFFLGKGGTHCLTVCVCYFFGISQTQF